MLKALLILMILSLSAWGNVTCVQRPNTAWQPYNKNTDTFIGKEQHGFKTEQDCLGAAKAGAAGICNWDGRGYTIYDSETGQDQAVGSYDTVDYCVSVLLEKKNDNLCLWNGQNWQPFSTISKKFLGISGFGFTKRTECVAMIEHSSSEYGCNWNGKNYSLYSTKGNTEVPVTDLSFLENSYCSNYIASIVKKSVRKKYSQSELLSLFNEKPANVGYTLGKCQDPSASYHLVATGEDGSLLPECVPDTLYSWGDYGKLKWFKDRYSTSGDWTAPFERDFFLTQSPLATFGYGEIPLRIKLRKDVKVILSKSSADQRSCANLTTDEKATSIILNRWNMFHGTGLDYILCSMGPVESWSFGTKEHYDEIVRDYQWIEKNNYKDYELYYKKDGVDQLWNTNLDGKTFTLEVLLKHLQINRELIDLKLGRVYEQRSGLSKTHYQTKNPIYYNPQ